MTKKQKRFLKIIISCFLIFNLSLGLITFNSEKDTIKIGLKNLPEQRIIGTILKQKIEADTDYNVKLIYGLDATSFINSAVSNQNIDLYVEYSSVSFLEIFDHNYNHQTAEEILKQVKNDYETKTNMTWITDLGFENSNEIICGEICRSNDITKYSQLNNYPEISFAAPVYFYERQDGYNMLKDTYDWNNIEINKMDPVIIYNAVKSNQIDTGLAFSTDAKLATGDYVVLEDDKNAMPKYDAGIIVNNESLIEYPDLEKELKLFDDKFTTEKIQEMNNQLENEHQSEKEIATKFITENF